MELGSSDTVAEQTNTLASDAVITGVAEKHESELKEKTVPDESESALHNEDSLKLSEESPKEDGELSSTRYLFGVYWKLRAVAIALLMHPSYFPLTPSIPSAPSYLAKQAAPANCPCHSGTVLCI